MFALSAALLVTGAAPIARRSEAGGQSCLAKCATLNDEARKKGSEQVVGGVVGQVGSWLPCCFDWAVPFTV